MRKRKREGREQRAEILTLLLQRMGKLASFTIRDLNGGASEGEQSILKTNLENALISQEDGKAQQSTMISSSLVQSPEVPLIACSVLSCVLHTNPHHDWLTVNKTRSANRSFPPLSSVSSQGIPMLMKQEVGPKLTTKTQTQEMCQA